MDGEESSEFEVNIETENSFSNLSDNEDFINPNKKLKRTENSIKKNAASSKGMSAQSNKVPPIKAYNLNVKVVSHELYTKMKHSNFTISNINKNMSVILTKTTTDYNIAITVLKDIKSKYYTYTLREVRPINLLLKGIHSTYDETEVVTALNSIKFVSSDTKILKAFRYSTTKSRNDKRILSTYIVQFAPTSKINEILSIKCLLHQRIEWENIKKHDIIQCKRCQRFGHAASNCGMPFRCVKCTNTHNPGECLNTRTNINPTSIDTTNPTGCIGCGQIGHPASWRGCPVYKKLIKRKQQRLAELKQQKEMSLNNYIQKDISFAQKITPTTSQPILSSSQFPLLPSNRSNTQTYTNADTHTQSSDVNNDTNTMTNLQSTYFNMQTDSSLNTNTSADTEPAASSIDAYSYLNNECKNNLGSDIIQVIIKVRAFLPVYKQISDSSNKQISLISFIMSLVDIP